MLPCCSRRPRTGSEVRWSIGEVPMAEAKEVASIDTREEHPANSSKAGPHGLPESRGTPALRRRLPDERHSLTHHFSVGGQEGFVTVGLYEDGLPGEMFIRMSKEGSTVSGLMDSWRSIVWTTRKAFPSDCGPMRICSGHRSVLRRRLSSSRLLCLRAKRSTPIRICEPK
jgi:hypothetical protein